MRMSSKQLCALSGLPHPPKKKSQKNSLMWPKISRKNEHWLPSRITLSFMRLQIYELLILSTAKKSPQTQNNYVFLEMLLWIYQPSPSKGLRSVSIDMQVQCHTNECWLQPRPWKSGIHQRSVCQEGKKTGTADVSSRGRYSCQKWIY